MTDHPLPRRITLDVPLRSTLVTTAVVATLALVIGSVWWLNSVAPLQSAAQGTASIRLGAGTPSASMGTVFAWRRGGAYQVQILFHNSSSLPLTVTGVDAISPVPAGTFWGPTLNLSSNGLDANLPFHSVRVAADGSALIGFTYHANARVCSSGSLQGPSQAVWVDSVKLHFEQVPGLPQTQTISLGDARFGMTNPTKRECAR